MDHQGAPTIEDTTVVLRRHLKGQIGVRHQPAIDVPQTGEEQ
jgi:hypothetical protein